MPGDDRAAPGGAAVGIAETPSDRARRLVDEPFPGLPHVLAAEHGLGMVAVHVVADPHRHASIPEGLDAAVDLAGVERGDSISRVCTGSPAVFGRRRLAGLAHRPPGWALGRGAMAQDRVQLASALIPSGHP